ncbi:MAG: FtsX-like permease family protein, partial [Candidatus Acidiferrales bacterium]
LPLGGQRNDTFFTTAATPPKSPGDAEDADFRTVAGDYFQAMRMPLLEGRPFSGQDQANTSPKVIVDQPFVRRYFAQKRPIGRHLLVYRGGTAFVSCEIVGVVGGIRHEGLRIAPRPTMYFPFAQQTQDDLNIVVRSAGDPTQIASGIRDSVAAVDPDEAVSSFQTMQQVVSASAAGDSFNAFLLGLFGVLALVLAAAGIYGVMSYTVTQRTHEIGIRLALGAEPRNVVRMVIRQGMALVAIGLILGLGLASAFAHLMASQIYGINAIDPATFAAAAVVLTTVALLACYIPARRAMRVDPMIALRYE